MCIRLRIIFFVLLFLSTAQPQGGARWKQELDSVKYVDPFMNELAIKAILTRCFRERTARYLLEIKEKEKEVEISRQNGDKHKTALELINLANLNEKAARYNEATRILLEAYNLADETGDSVVLGMAMIRIDDLNYVKHRVTVHKANTYKGVEYLKKSPDSSVLASYHFTKAKLVSDPGAMAYHITEAYNIQKKIVAKDSANPAQLLTLSKYLNSMSIISPNAEYYLKEAIRTGMVSKSYYFILFYINNLGNLYERNKEYQKALEQYHYALQLCIKERFPTLLRNTTSNISRVYRTLGNHAEASRYAKIQILAIECGHEEIAEVKYDELRIQYDVQKKESMLADLVSESSELKRIVTLETWQKYILGFGVLVLVIVAVHIQISRRKISAVNVAIEAEKNIVSGQKAELEKLYTDLSENERSLKEAQAIARLANWQWNIEEDRLTYSENLPSLFGLRRDEVMGDFRQVVLPKVVREDLQIYKNYMFGDHLIMRNQEAAFRIHAGRNIRWIHTKFSIIYDQSHVPQRIIHTVQDITLQKVEEENKIKLAEQRTYTRQLIDSQETERRRIAGELHDGLGQEILLLKSKTQLGLINPKLGEDGKEKLKEIGSMADDILQTIRVITFDLSPVHLNRVGLSETINECVSKVKEDSAIEFSYQICDVDHLFPLAEEVIIFRIIQEILNNIIKHSHAHQAKISIVNKNKWLLIVFRDDGIGFDVKQKRKTSKGYGLGNIYNRVNILNGKMRIVSTKDEGTEIKIKIPIRNNAGKNKNHNS